MGDSLLGRSFGSPKFCKRKFSFLYGFSFSFVFLLLKYELNVVKLQVQVPWSVLGDKVSNFRCHGCDIFPTSGAVDCCKWFHKTTKYIL